MEKWRGEVLWAFVLFIMAKLALPDTFGTPPQWVGWMLVIAGFCSLIHAIIYAIQGD